MVSDAREREWVQQDQILIHVTLDEGVFHWLHGIVTAKHETVAPHYVGWIDWYPALVKRAYDQFNAAIAPNGEAVVPTDQPRRRVIHRRVAKK
jgi:hypothetical protein